MFDSLALENPKRKWATMMSFALETTFVVMLIAAPLAFTDKLPSLRIGEILIAPSAPVSPAPTATEVQPTTQPVTTEFRTGHLVYIGKIPLTITKVIDNMSDNSGPVDPNAIVGAPPNGKTNTAIQNLVRGLNPVPLAAAPKEPTGRVSISHLDPGFLVQRVQPIYPRTAILTRTEGTVVLTAVIDTSGRITHLQVVSGPTLLISAAMEAVRQWRYKPYILNGSPVEVETQVSVIFNLNAR